MLTADCNTLKGQFTVIIENKNISTLTTSSLYSWGEFI